jgi:hypothetical protein
LLKGVIDVPTYITSGLAKSLASYFASEDPKTREFLNIKVYYDPENDLYYSKNEVGEFTKYLKEKKEAEENNEDFFPSKGCRNITHKYDISNTKNLTEYGYFRAFCRRRHAVTDDEVFSFLKEAKAKPLKGLGKLEIGEKL